MPLTWQVQSSYYRIVFRNGMSTKKKLAHEEDKSIEGFFVAAIVMKL
jgi:hypothetical protein